MARPVRRMALLEASVVVDVPGVVVWDLLTDTRAWPLWGPSVAGVDCADRFIAAGTVGRVRTALGPSLSFRVTAFEPGRSWTWSVAGIPATGHRVEPLGPARCRVVFEVPFWAAPYLLVCRLAAGRIKALAEGRRPF